jgi:TP901 family phage tail tape measure protein
MALVIPTVFTAVDKFSRPLVGMGSAASTAAVKMEGAFQRVDRQINKTFSILNSAQKEFLSNIGAAAIAGAVTGAVAYSVKAIMDYETALANLKAVTGASGKDFDVFKEKINDVAKATKESSVNVTNAFTAIANNQPELLKDAAALALVTQSSIMLAQASKMELQPAGEALTQILNQFGKGAKEAAATVDILAAGSVAGSSEIRDSAAAIQEFGTVAANAGIKINESVALIELASKFDKGTEAGTKLRNILLVMSTAKVQDPKAIADMHRLGINMNVVQNAALPLNDRLQEMAKAAKDNAALFHIFGKENQALATGVLANADNFTTMLDAVNTTGMTAKMAADNNNTLSRSLEFMKNSWVNVLTSSTSASIGLRMVSSTVNFLSDHMTGIVTIITLLTTAFIAWKAVMLTTTIATKAYTIWTGLASVASGIFSGQVTGLTRAMGFYELATTGAIFETEALTVAMAATGVGALVIGVGLLGVALYAAFGKNEDLNSSLTKTAKLSDDILGKIKDKTAAEKAAAREEYLTNAAGNSAEKQTQIYNERLAKIDLESQKATANANIVLAEEKKKSIAEDVAKIGRTKSFLGFPYQTSEPEPTAPAINTKKVEQDAIIRRSESTQKQNVKIEVNDNTGRANVSSDNNMVPITTTRTQGSGFNLNN